jgi:GrpB-like predicted nucleotidyltransferase (UPF0157 family)
MARHMTVVDYSNEWPKQYEREQDLLQATLGDVLESVHHIGSTSVPGLAAKPVIDILLEVQSLDRLDALNSAMESIGYTPKGEFGIPGRRYFPKGGDERTHHVHAFASGDPLIAKYLAFRDYLRAHPAAVAEYAAVKMAASAAHQTDPEGYVAFKHGFVEQMVAKAVHWMSEEQTECSQEEQS